MKRKAVAEDMVSFVLIICTLVIVLVGGIAWRSLASQNASEVMYHYTLAIKDKEVQLLKDGFEKSAAFFALMSTARELALHGGLSEDALSVGGPPYIADVNPSLRFEVLAEERIPYWVVPSETTCGNTGERVPYFSISNPQDFLSYVGEPYAPEGASASNLFVLLGNSKHDKYIADINAEKYSLMVLVRIYFLKPGSVTVECGNGCLAMEPAGGTPDKLITDGLYLYKITSISGTFATMELKFTATGDDGDGRKVAKIEQVVVSIYDNSIVDDANNLFTENLNPYHNEMKTTLSENSAGKPSETTIDTLAGSIYRKNTYSFTGSVWPEAGIRSETEDYLGNDQLLVIQSSGMTEETTKIRYWLLYTYAEKFARGGIKVLERRLWEMMEDLEDESHPKMGITKYGCHDECKICKDDTTNSYDAASIEKKIEFWLNDLSDEYTILSAPGITWSIKIPADLFEACPKTNPNKEACDPPDTCDDASENFEHYEYKAGIMYSFRQDCSEKVRECTKGKKVNSGSAKGSVIEPIEAGCTMEYYHRYVLKNLKVFVTITDSQYKVFNEATGVWDPLEFKFFVFMPIIDDNCCNNRKCSTYRSGACSKPADIAPAL